MTLTHVPFLEENISFSEDVDVFNQMRTIFMGELCFEEVFCWAIGLLKMCFMYLSQVKCNLLEWKNLLIFMFLLYKYRFTNKSLENFYCCLLLWHIIYLLLIVRSFLGFNYIVEQMFCYLKNKMAPFYSFWFNNENTLEDPITFFFL